VTQDVIGTRVSRVVRQWFQLVAGPALRSRRLAMTQENVKKLTLEQYFLFIVLPADRNRPSHCDSCY
jgi:hypothetical protein